MWERVGMAELRRGVKAGVVSGVIYGFVGGVLLGLVTIEVIFPVLTVPEFTTLFGGSFAWIIFVGVLLIGPLVGAIGGLILGLIFAALYGRLPGRKSMVKGVILAVVTSAIALGPILGLVAAPGLPSEFLFLLPVLIALGLGTSVLWGVLLGTLWDRLGRRSLMKVLLGSFWERLSGDGAMAPTRGMKITSMLAILSGVFFLTLGVILLVGYMSFVSFALSSVLFVQILAVSMMVAGLALIISALGLVRFKIWGWWLSLNSGLGNISASMYTGVITPLVRMPTGATSPALGIESVIPGILLLIVLVVRLGLLARKKAQFGRLTAISKVRLGGLACFALIPAMASGIAFSTVASPQALFSSSPILEETDSRVATIGESEVRLVLSTLEGHIILSPTSSDKLSISLIKRGTEDGLENIGIEFSDDVVNGVHTVRFAAQLLKPSFLSQKQTVHIEALVPTKAAYALDLQTANGRIEVDRINGTELIAETMNGDITLNEIDFRRVEAQTWNGFVAGTARSDDLDFQTLNGEINLSVLGAGKYSLLTFKGDITATLRSGLPARVDAKTVNGSPEWVGAPILVIESGDFLGGGVLAAQTEGVDEPARTIVLRATSLNGDIEVTSTTP